jgi:hypothetical protein
MIALAFPSPLSSQGRCGVLLAGARRAGEFFTSGQCNRRFKRSQHTTNGVPERGTANGRDQA